MNGTEQFDRSIASVPKGPIERDATPAQPAPVKPRLRILGIRGIPARHGGFETFAEHLALHLVSRGWEVVVYCQAEGEGPFVEDQWQGVHRVLIPSGAGSLGSIRFDWRVIAHAARHRDLCLTLGYNTAVFCARLRRAGVPNVINMDGIEWARGKWGLASKAWFYLNEWAGCLLGDCLVADHPEIQKHLQTRLHRGRVPMVPYGAREIVEADPAIVRRLGLEPDGYYLVIARPEPENSLLEIVRGYSRRPRDRRLVLIGDYDDRHPYRRAVRRAAGAAVLMPGAIYDADIVGSLRFHATAYLHGHRVGGTNPSLVESLGAGNAIVAHDNRFNRWVAGPSMSYFGTEADLDECLAHLEANPSLLQEMRAASRVRHRAQFTFERIHAEYEALLRSYVEGPKDLHAVCAAGEARAADLDSQGGKAARRSATLIDTHGAE